MGATYDSTLKSKKDQVRFRLQDTDTSAATLQDEEILWALAQKSQDVLSAAILLADTLTLRFGSQSSISVGDIRIDYSTKAEQYRTMAGSLRAESVRGATPFAGGLTLSGKEAVEDDDDRVPPAFTVGQHDDLGPTL